MNYNTHISSTAMVEIYNMYNRYNIIPPPLKCFEICISSTCWRVYTPMYTHRRQTSFRMWHCDGVCICNIICHTICIKTPKTQKSYTAPYSAISVLHHMSPATLQQLFRIVMEEVNNIGTHVLYTYTTDAAAVIVYVPRRQELRVSSTTDLRSSW